MNNLPSMSQEERLAAQEKSKASREAKKAYAEASLKLDYLDDNYWSAKSSELNIRLPQRFEVGAKGMRKVAKKLGLDIKAFLESTGCSNLNELVNLNPNWSGRALAGLVLEFHLERQNAI